MMRSNFSSSFFALSRAAAPVRKSTSVAAFRSFASSRAVLAGKESQLHNENRAAEVEAQKQEQLRKQKEGKGEWTENLASDSESAVKADKGEISNSKDTIKEMQQETAKQAEKEQK